MSRAYIPPPSQRKNSTVNYREVQKKTKKRKLKKKLFRAFFTLVFLVFCVIVLSMIFKFIFGRIFNENDGSTDFSENPVEEPVSVSEDPADADTGKLDLHALIDPSTLNPNEAIDINYLANEKLPQVYSTSKTPYRTFASDQPQLGSNDKTRVIVVDAGHQTDTRTSDVWLSPYLDPEKSSSWVRNSLLKIGTTGVSTKKPEYETTHEIAELLKNALEEIGYTVILSHPNVEEKLSGSERAAVANQNDADLMLSLHCNSYESDRTVNGALALVPESFEGYPSKRLEYLSERAGTVLLSEYAAATGFKNRGLDPIIKSSLFAFCKVPIVLFELGYSSCPSEDKKMNDDEFREKMVEGLVNGINKYFSLIDLHNEIYPIE